VLEIVIEDRKGRYLIPARLPLGKFVTNARALSKMITRLYGFSTMPIDFWSRVISRFLNFSEFGSTMGYDIWEGIDIDARREVGCSIILHKNQNFFKNQNFVQKTVFLLKI